MQTVDREVPRALALIGMMGAGKTTTGRLLAAHLQRPFLDSDAEVEARTGRTVAQIFAEDGEPAFRAWETKVLTEALDGDDPVVVGVAGGAVLAEENRRMLEDATVIWLEVPIDVLVARVVARAEQRPLIADDPDGVMRRLYEQRRPVYEALADHRVDNTGPPEATVQRILEVFR